MSQLISSIPPIKIVYFAYLIPNVWKPIIEEQLTALANTNLYDLAEEIFITVNIVQTEDLVQLIELLKERWPKVKLGYVSYRNDYEYLGIFHLHVLSQEYSRDCILLYFHSKGMTSNLPKIRQNLFKYTIENYQEYVNAFSTNPELDIAGAVPHKDGFIFFNFFWIRSNYIRKYCPWPNPTSNRFIWEVWFGGEYSTKKRNHIKTWSPLIGWDQIEYKHGQPWCSLFDLLNG